MEILGAEIECETATLNVIGHESDGSQVEGEIRMQFEDGAWRISNESYQY